MKAVFRLGLAISALFLVASPLTAQEPDEDARIDAIIAAMSTEDRVGQLFLVEFPGPDVDQHFGTRDLIQNYRIGGVLVTSNNIDNDADNTPLQVATLINDLQRLAHMSTRHEGPTGEVFLPLFVAVDQEGDGIPRTHFWNGATPIPSAMAIGATWNPADAEKVGAIIGHELRAVGINMLLGPVLDVLIQPRPEGAGDISIRVIGGDPYWVGILGRAYIRGVHRGGGGRVLTIAKHFPGHGASDRNPDHYVPTVNKSLHDLSNSDLIPFFAASRADSGDLEGTTDGMMPSHIRYRGLQGNPTYWTKPISLDRHGLAAFLELEPLNEWRSNGGLIVCDALGTGGLEAFYDPSGRTFPHRQVARDALMAGNDVLPAVSFSLGRPWSTGTLPNVKDTITYFRNQYENDPQFRERVDDALRHILRAKLRLYPDLSFESAQVEATRVDELVGREQDSEAVYQVALDALTLLYPSPQDPLYTRLPSPPRINEDILIMGCFDGCRRRLPAEDMLKHLLNLYGPSGSGQVDPGRVQVVNFTALNRLIDGTLSSGQAGVLRDQIDDAEWILLVLLNHDDDAWPATTAGRRFLSNTSFDLQNKKVVAIAYHAPYYLDATETSRLTAYYAVYSKIDPFIQVSLQALFQDVAPTGGASPVSVDGIGYDLQTYLQPDIEAVTLTSIPHDAVHEGDRVQIRTAPIRDLNGHLVRDGTQVKFTGRLLETGVGLSPDVVSSTVEGVASAHFNVLQPGTVEILAHCGDHSSRPLLLNVLRRITPTPIVTPSSEPSPTPRITESPEPAPTATPTVALELPPLASPPWKVLLAIAGVGLVIGLGIGVKLIRHRYLPVEPGTPPRRDDG